MSPSTSVTLAEVGDILGERSNIIGSFSVSVIFLCVISGR
jgi:hypothetical protein